MVDALYVEEIGVGHALLLAKLQSHQQEAALAPCFREYWSGAGKQKRILLPVRNLQFWIDNKILFVFKDAKRPYYGPLVMSEEVPKSATKCAGNAKFWWGTPRGTVAKEFLYLSCFQCPRIPGATNRYLLALL